LSQAYEGIGGILVTQREWPGAISAYRAAATSVEALYASDAENSRWPRELADIHERIGDVLKSQGEPVLATDEYRKALTLIDSLVSRDAANTQWQSDLSEIQERIGAALVAQGDEQGALMAYRSSLALREVLATRDPSNVQWQIDLASSCFDLGTIGAGQTRPARHEYLVRGKALLSTLKATGKLPVSADRIENFNAELAK
jgi:tetratricopeptide (TPR) repeat protein